MRTRILNLDGSLLEQHALHSAFQSEVLRLEGYGPRIRLGGSFSRFGRFEVALANAAGCATDDEPCTTLYGSGDFHHVSLALLRRLQGPFNLVVFDNHPDWMRGVPLMHCGTWLYHAARLPQVQRIYHIGGDVDFDNYYQWLAPWRLLESGKITVFPAWRTFQGRRWRKIVHTPLRDHADASVATDRWRDLLSPYSEDLLRWPLYVSLDKDVMRADEAPVNWDSGHLTLREVCDGLECLMEITRGNLLGMDIVGDWSPVRVQGLLRRWLHFTEHPSLEADAASACSQNEQTNLELLEVVNLARNPNRSRNRWP